MNDRPFPKEVAAPARRALASIGVTDVRQCADHTEKQLADLHGMGPKALNAIRLALENLGLHFKT